MLEVSKFCTDAQLELSSHHSLGEHFLQRSGQACPACIICECPQLSLSSDLKIAKEPVHLLSLPPMSLWSEMYYVGYTYIYLFIFSHTVSSYI